MITIKEKTAGILLFLGGLFLLFFILFGENDISEYHPMVYVLMLAYLIGGFFVVKRNL